MIWRTYRKRKALRSYRTVLAKRLRGRYGTQKHYTPAQVEDTVRSYGLSDVFVCYALAMYCEQVAFDLHHAARGEACDYAAMRDELGARLFGGDTSFDGTTLTDDASIDAACDGGGAFDASGFDAGGCSSD